MSTPMYPSNKIKPEMAKPVHVTTAEDFYFALMPSYWLSKIIGVLHLSFEGQPPNRKLIVSKNFIYLAAVRILIVFAVVAFFHTSLIYEGLPDEMTTVVLDIDVYCGIIVTIIELISAMLSRKSDLRTIEQFIELDKRLSSAGIKIDYIKARRVAIIEIALVLAQNIFKTIMLVITAPYRIILINSGLNIMSMLNSFQLNEYINMVLMLKQRFNWLNKAILDNYERKWRRDDCKKSEVKKNIQTYGKLYNDLRKLSKRVDSTFGFFVLVLIISRFIMLNTLLIYLYTTIKNPNIRNGTEYASIAINTGFHAYKLIMITCIPASATNKVNMIKI